MGLDSLLDLRFTYVCAKGFLEETREVLREEASTRRDVNANLTLVEIGEGLLGKHGLDEFLRVLGSILLVALRLTLEPKVVLALLLLIHSCKLSFNKILLMQPQRQTLYHILIKFNINNFNIRHRRHHHHS